MVLEEFHKELHGLYDQKNIKNQDRINKYLDESICLYSLIKSNCSSDIDISFKESNNKATFIVKPMNDNIDLSSMQDLYHNIEIGFFSHKYKVQIKKKEKNLHIKLVE